MDFADIASSLQEADLTLCLSARSRPTLARTGECHYCEADVQKEHLFCDNDCSADWERLQGAHRRAGTSIAQGHVHN